MVTRGVFAQAAIEIAARKRGLRPYAELWRDLGPRSLRRPGERRVRSSAEAVASSALSHRRTSAVLQPTRTCRRRTLCRARRAVRRRAASAARHHAAPQAAQNGDHRARSQRDVRRPVGGAAQHDDVAVGTRQRARKHERADHRRQADDERPRQPPLANGGERQGDADRRQRDRGPVQDGERARRNVGHRRLAHQQLAAKRPVELQRPVGGTRDGGGQRGTVTRAQRAEDPEREAAAAGGGVAVLGQ
jgi:hypothetical protein